MEKLISDESFMACLSTSYFKASGNMDLFYDDLFESLTKRLPDDKEISDIELVNRSEDKWNVILTLNDDTEYLYTVKTSDIIK